jgi:hypothetical protein
MSRLFPRHAILPALFAAALALPTAAEDAHHPPADQAKPPATQPAQPRAAEPSAPGGMMSGNMMQMMHQMMSTMMMQNSGAMHRMRMMGMGDMGMMGQMQGRGPAVERVEGHIAYLKAELKITAAQGKAWDDYAAALRANAKQLNEVVAERAKAPAAASPVERIALEEKTLAARLEIARRTKPALAALYAAFSDDQKKTFSQLAAPRMGMH